MEIEVMVDAVERVDTRFGKPRWVVRDDDGREYMTFSPRIGEEAERCKGQPARIEYHEEDRDGLHSVYLDAIEPALIEID